MSRILDALRKVDAERSGTLPPVAEPPRGRRRAEGPREARLALPAAPAAADPAEGPGVDLPESPSGPWVGEPLPGLPEDFRRELAGLRLQVESALAGRRPRVLMAVSSTAGEGTTTVAASFARVLAQDASTRVLLVDANARRPGVGPFFGLPDAPGLVEVLHHGQPFESAIRSVERENLHALTALPGDALGGHLYAQQLVRDFLGRWGGQYDYVIFDAPPVLESPETSVLGGVVDTSLLVVRAASTKSGVVSRAVDTLAKAGVPVLGVVLNRRRLDIPEFIYRRI